MLLMLFGGWAGTDKSDAIELFMRTYLEAIDKERKEKEAQTHNE